VTAVSPLALGLGVVAGCATYAGGMVVLNARSRFGSLLGLAAGMVIGVALFDLLPEAIEAGGDRPGPFALLACTGLALIGYMIIDRLTDRGLHASGWVRVTLAPASLTLHSFIDGTGIGVAFALAPSAGWLVAIAVIAHDLADGVNTVSLAVSTGGESAGRNWLIANAVAPVTGVLVGGALSVPGPTFALLLAGFAGIFLYIGAVHLLPRSHAVRPATSTSLASVAGAVFMLCVVNLARHLQ
jgi:zinc transporter ZupT